MELFEFEKSAREIAIGVQQGEPQAHEVWGDQLTSQFQAITTLLRDAIHNSAT